MDRDKLQIITFPTYGEVENGAITDQTVWVSYKGENAEFSCPENGVDDLITDKFFVVLYEINSTNHYRFLSRIDGKTHYDLDGIPLMTLKEALELKSDFNNAEGYWKMRNTYNVYRIMRYDPISMDWIRSYMPLKRSKITLEQRKAVYAKCDGHCAYCGKPIAYEEMQVDHVESHYRHQGKDDVDNYLPACRDCNGLKSDYLLEEFRCVLIPSCAKKGAYSGAKASRANRIAKAYGLNGITKKKIVFYFEKERGK